jgi:hypothetical protein
MMIQSSGGKLQRAHRFALCNVVATCIFHLFAKQTKKQSLVGGLIGWLTNPGAPLNRTSWETGDATAQTNASGKTYPSSRND